ncbi:MAG TPA: DUF5134 domain-containing protein [Methylocystis sp.]|nr:DUF5134 domain-containing protein [Methylocystis sp.]
MAQLGRELLSETPSLLWLTALAVVLLFHCSHLLGMRGEPRWYHSAHAVMLLGMLYMFAGTAFRLHLVPPRTWTLVYLAASAVILSWMLIKLARKRPLKKLWVAAFIQQVAMIYMWAPMGVWLPLLTYGFVLYFSVELIAWLTNACSKLEPLAAWEAHSRHAGGSLEPRSIFGDVCMSIMAASMAYMFVAMQLMASTPARPQQVAENRLGSPSGSASTPQQAQSEPEAPLQLAKPPPKLEPQIATSRGGESYKIAVGDTLWGIAARAYGDARLWGRIAKANPALDPRHLPVGQMVALPKPSSESKQ